MIHRKGDYIVYEQKWNNLHKEVYTSRNKNFVNAINKYDMNNDIPENNIPRGERHHIQQKMCT